MHRNTELRVRDGIRAFAVLGAGLLFFATGADALPLPNPVSGESPEYFLQNPDLIRLNQGPDYTIEFVDVNTDEFVNAAGGRLGVSVEVTFDIDEVDGLMGEDVEVLEVLLLFTSIRLGGVTGSLTCDGLTDGSLPLAAAGYVAEGFTGDLDRTTFVGDADGAGTVCDSEGDTFLAVAFSPSDGETTYEFDLTMELTGSLDNFNIQLLNRAYAVTELVVPEAGTVLLLLLGAAGFAGATRFRGRRA